MNQLKIETNGQQKIMSFPVKRKEKSSPGNSKFPFQFPHKSIEILPLTQKCNKVIWKAYYQDYSATQINPTESAQSIQPNQTSANIPAAQKKKKKTTTKPLFVST